ncbi:MAG: twin-arginine translocase subunit TatC [Desulfotalea sp.]
MSDRYFYRCNYLLWSILHCYKTDWDVLLCTSSVGSSREYFSYFYVLPRRVFFYLKLALVCGILLASPVIFSQFWRFIAPGLFKHERKIVIPFTILSTICFVGGAAFGYLVVFPPAFSFLVGYNNEFLTSLPGVSEYFTLATRLLLAFGFIFEMPIMMVFLAKAGLIDVKFLNKHRKYAILLDFVVAAILTPTPDVVNQLMMAVPLMVLYEISVVMVWLFGRKNFKGFSGEEKE